MEQHRRAPTVYNMRTIPIFGSRFIVVGAPSADECVARLPKSFRAVANDAFKGNRCDGMTLWSEELCATAVAFVYHKGRVGPMQDVVTHECTHAAEHILEMHRIEEHPEKTQELLAYVAGWCANTVAGVFMSGRIHM